MTALAFDSSQGMSASPLFEMYRIECRDCASMQRIEELLRQASVDPDKPLSWHPALRAQHLADGESVSLSPTGEVGFAGRAVPSERRQARVANMTT